MLVLGLKGWVPAKWPGGMPSISLIAFVIAIVPLFVKRRLVKDRDQKKAERESRG